MKRWDFEDMLGVGCALFARIHRQKKHASPNHDVHFMARELDKTKDNWLNKGINALMDGTYTPRFLTRYYFEDAMVDQLHVSDRILQHLLLKQLKPTFSYVMNPNCYHLQGHCARHANRSTKWSTMKSLFYGSQITCNAGEHGG